MSIVTKLEKFRRFKEVLLADFKKSQRGFDMHVVDLKEYQRVFDVYLADLEKYQRAYESHLAEFKCGKKRMTIFCMVDGFIVSSAGTRIFISYKTAAHYGLRTTIEWLDSWGEFGDFLIDDCIEKHGSRLEERKMINDFNRFLVIFVANDAVIDLKQRILSQINHSIPILLCFRTMKSNFMNSKYLNGFKIRWDQGTNRLSQGIQYAGFRSPGLFEKLHQ